MFLLPSKIISRMATGTGRGFWETSCVRGFILEKLVTGELEAGGKEVKDKMIKDEIYEIQKRNYE